MIIDLWNQTFFVLNLLEIDFQVESPVHWRPKAQHRVPACKWFQMTYYLIIFNNILIGETLGVTCVTMTKKQFYCDWSNVMHTGPNPLIRTTFYELFPKSRLIISLKSSFSPCCIIILVNISLIYDHRSVKPDILCS